LRFWDAVEEILGVACEGGGEFGGEVGPESPGWVGGGVGEGFGGGIGGAERGGGDHAAVGDKDEVLGVEVDDVIFAFVVDVQLPCSERTWFLVKVNVGHCHAVPEIDVLVFEPGGNGKDQGVELVVDRPVHTGEGADPRKFLNEAVQVAFVFYERVPGLEGERCGPHVPKVGGEEVGAEEFVDGFAAEVCFRAFPELEEFEAVCVAS